MSNYPDNVDFSRMSWETPCSRAQGIADERETTREQDDIRCKAHDAARRAGDALKGLGLSERSLEIIAESLCEELIQDDYYAPALEALHGSYKSIGAALVNAASPEAKGKARHQTEEAA